MELFKDSFLTILVFFPVLWGFVGTLLPTQQGKSFGLLKGWTFLGTLISFAMSVLLFMQYEPNGAEFQFIEKAEWIPALGISYFVGIDGIALLLIVLTNFLMPLVILGSFTAVEKRVKEYYLFLLALQSGMIGAFVALDLFLFYVYWEAMLIPMYFLIGIWGGKNRIFAALKFFLFTVVGSLLMLVAIFYLAHHHSIQFGNFSTSILDLYRVKIPGGDIGSPQSLLFMAFALAFAIKVPLFPLHTWLPDAHVEAPTSGSVILAGVLLKMGGYGFIRFAFPLFPEAVKDFQFLFMALATIAIVYGALVAMVQPDIKKLVAYSSVSHMGYVVLGLFSMNSIGVTGSIYQMLNHGISTGALFLLVGMIYERRHTREISDFGGIAKVMPVFTVVFLIVTLSSIALPGTNGFVGEFLILLGSWKTNPWLTAVSGTGVILGAVYMLWMFRRVMFGELTNPENKGLKDLGSREKFVLLPLLIAIFVMGIVPNFFFKPMESSVQRLLQRAQGQAVSAQSPIALPQKDNAS